MKLPEVHAWSDSCPLMAHWADSNATPPRQEKEDQLQQLNSVSLPLPAPPRKAAVVGSAIQGPHKPHGVFVSTTPNPQPKNEYFDSFCCKAQMKVPEVEKPETTTNIPFYRNSNLSELLSLKGKQIKNQNL